MDKLWYILDQETQFGPFDEKDLQGMFKSRKITRETTLIKSGYKRPIQVKDLVKSVQTPQVQEVTSKIYSEFSYKKSKPKIKEAPPPPPPPQMKSSSKERRISKLAVIPIFLLVIGILGYMSAKSFVTAQSFNLERPKKVRSKAFYSYKKKMQNAYDNKKHAWSFLFSKDLKNIYVGSSLPGIQSVRLNFKSIPDKIMSNQLIQFTSEIKIEDNIAEVKEFNFIKGDKVIPGAYTVELELTKQELGLWQQLLLDPIRAKKSHKEEIILKFHSKNTFSRELAKFQKVQKRRDNAFVQDIKMKYETLLTIANTITQNLNKAKSGPNSKSQVEFRKNYFLQDYQMKYGTFFSNFVIENEKKFKDLTNSSDELKTGIIAHYSTLSSIARSLGMVSIDAIDSFMGLLDNQETFQPILKRYEAIITTCKNKIDKLENIDIKQ